MTEQRIEVHRNFNGSCLRCGLSLKIREADQAILRISNWPNDRMIAIRRKAQTFVAYLIENRANLNPEIEILCRSREAECATAISNLTARLEILRPHTERKEDGESKTETQS